MPASLVLPSLLRSKEPMERETGVITSDRNNSSGKYWCWEETPGELLGCMGWKKSCVFTSYAPSRQKGAQEQQCSTGYSHLQTFPHQNAASEQPLMLRCFLGNWLCSCSLWLYLDLLLDQVWCIRRQLPSPDFQGYHSVVSFLSFFKSVSAGAELWNCHSSSWVN